MKSDDHMLDLVDFLEVASAVSGLSMNEVGRVTAIGSAESALAAPFASFDGQAFYPDPIERAAVLCSRIVRIHPLPDGNKRVAYLLMAEQLHRDGFDLNVDADQQGAAEVVEQLAAREVSESEFTDWLREHVGPVENDQAA